MKLALQNDVAISNDEVRQLDRAYVFHSWSMQGNLNPLVIAGAKGCELWDYEGNTYLDFSSQLVNVNIGYQHPRVLAAMKAQLEELVTIAPATANLVRGEAAKRIVELAPEGFSKVFFTNAGPMLTRTPSAWRDSIPGAIKCSPPIAPIMAIPAARLPPPATGVVCRTVFARPRTLL
jgi:hypothetical protein